MKSGPQIGCGLEDQVPTQWGSATSSATANGAKGKLTVSAATTRRTRFGSDGLHFACRPTVRVSAGTGVNSNPGRAFGRKQGATVFFIWGDSVRFLQSWRSVLQVVICLHFLLKLVDTLCTGEVPPHIQPVSTSLQEDQLPAVVAAIGECRRRSSRRTRSAAIGSRPSIRLVLIGSHRSVPCAAPATTAPCGDGWFRQKRRSR